MGCVISLGIYETWFHGPKSLRVMSRSGFMTIRFDAYFLFLTLTSSRTGWFAYALLRYSSRPMSVVEFVGGDPDPYTSFGETSPILVSGSSTRDLSVIKGANYNNI
jgi:hypothetical protein